MSSRCERRAAPKSSRSSRSATTSCPETQCAVHPLTTTTGSTVASARSAVTNSPWGVLPALTCAFKSAVAIGEIHEMTPRAGSSSSTADDVYAPFGAGFVLHRGIGADTGTGSAMFSATPSRSVAIALSMILRWPRRTPSFSRSDSLSSDNTGPSKALSRNVSTHRSSESPRSQSAIS